MHEWTKRDLNILEKALDSQHAIDVVWREQFIHKYSRSEVRRKAKEILEGYRYTTTDEISISSPGNKQTPVEDLWKSFERRNVEHIENIISNDMFHIDFKTKVPIAISFVSDQHIDADTACDIPRMRRDAEFIQETEGMYACLMGDGVNNHIKHRAGLITSKTTPAEQYRLYDYYLSLFASKILVMCSGNHDIWTETMAGIDMVSKLAESNKVHYAKHSATVMANVGEVTYELAFRHQYKQSSAYNQTHAVKQWLRMGDSEFDIGAIGHEHEAAIESFMYRGLERWVCRPGSYQLTSGYAQTYGFSVSTPTCPTFVLYPNKREIIGFSDLYRAGEFLKYARTASKR